LALSSIICLSGQWFAVRATAQHDEAKGDTIAKAVALLTPTKGSHVSGRVTFTQNGRSIHVHAEISGLSPGEHGFHIHEFGVWSEDGMAAGSHFNPTRQPHAGPDSRMRHVGDLGNVTANANGNATYDRDDGHMSFHGSHAIVGRSVIVHEKADDLRTQQPPGNAGGRLAVGVIGVAKP
jgi:Cu-Zn family superoxide dismutase